MLSQYAILLDGGFVTKKLQTRLKRFPTADDVAQACKRIAGMPQLANRDLLRIYFYDASPAVARLTNPIDHSAVNRSATEEYRRHISLLDALALTPKFAVRRVELVVRGWRLGEKAFPEMVKIPRVPGARDIVPD